MGEGKKKGGVGEKDERYYTGWTIAVAKPKTENLESLHCRVFSPLLLARSDIVKATEA